jgi:hypothetical protein
MISSMHKYAVHERHMYMGVFCIKYLCDLFLSLYLLSIELSA